MRFGVSGINFVCMRQRRHRSPVGKVHSRPVHETLFVRYRWEQAFFDGGLHSISRIQKKFAQMSLLSLVLALFFIPLLWLVGSRIRHFETLWKEPWCDTFLKSRWYDVPKCLTSKYTNTNTQIHKYSLGKMNFPSDPRVAKWLGLGPHVNWGPRHNLQYCLPDCQ